jgi:hypothetical protein
LPQDGILHAAVLTRTSAQRDELRAVLFAAAKRIATVARMVRQDDPSMHAESGAQPSSPYEPVMVMKFRKLSIKSRKRTLGLAGLALVMEMVVSHPRFDMAAGVAQVARVAAPAVMASLATLTRTGNTPREAAPEVPAVVPVMEHTAELCAKMRRVES